MRRTVVTGILLATPFVTAAVGPTRSVLAQDPDIWWRMRTAQWILSHRALPSVETFAWPVAGRPYAEYSWVFDVVLESLYRHGGLTATAAFTLAVSVGIAVFLFVLLARRSRNPLVAAIVVSLAMLGIAGVLMPRPWLFTILLFTAEIALLLEVRRSGNVRQMLWLVAIFFLWANLHIQFVYGLIVAGLFLADCAAQKRIPFKWLGLTVLGAWCSTLLTPFGLDLYRTVLEYANQTSAYGVISEFRAPEFRHATDYVVVLALAAAAFAAGRAKKGLEPFLIATCVAGTFFAFRSVRDSWFLIIPAAFVICNSGAAPLRLPRGTYAIAAATAAVMVTLLAAHGLQPKNMQAVVSQSFPVQACDFMESQQWNGRLFNNFNWGGYLMWRLPRSQVSMDGRTNVHDDQRFARQIQTENGYSDWDKNPDLVGAKIVILPRQLPLASLLRLSRGFRLVYEDAVASVFLRDSGP